jgi:ATP-dependent RNA helicase DDX21
MNSVSEYDNGLDDLDYNWDNKSSNSDDSISYEAPPVKKLKTAAKVIVKEKAQPKVVKPKAKKAADNPPIQVQPKLKSKTVQKVKSKVPLVSESLISNDESAEKEKKFQNTGETSFPLDQFDLTESTVKHLNDRGIESLFPIQAQTYWPIRQGKDLIGRARTGQGINY